jgi:DNA methyltransferase 1-associated protein 1
MGDIAHILGVPSRDAPPKVAVPRAVQMQQLPQEVLDVMGSSGGDLPTSIPAVKLSLRKKQKPAEALASSTDAAQNATDTVVKVGNQWISSSKPARSWIWAPFASSARNDGLQLHHWVRNHVEYPDYPYARFNIHLDAVVVGDATEYRTLLHDPDWGASETEQLLELARRYELRWPVIYDRWMEECSGYAESTVTLRNIEDLQYRYYTVAAILLQHRISVEANAEAQALAARHAHTTDERTTMDSLLIETAAARALATTDPRHQPLLHNPGTGASNKIVFDLHAERQRRKQWQALWQRTKEEELEEAELRKELKQVEIQLRKLKKAGAHVLAAAATNSRSPSRAPTPIPLGGSNASSVEHAVGALEHALATLAPVAVAGTPYLQSGRLVPPASGVNKALLARMDDVLEELGVSKTPIATKRVCDLYDAVRKDVLTLLIFQKEVLLKEGQLASKRLRWSKKTGQAVVDEEALLGILPPPTAVTTGQAVASANSKAARSNKIAKPENKNKKKASPSNKATSAAPPVGEVLKEVPAATKALRKPAPSAKRKRKAEEMGADPTLPKPVPPTAPSATAVPSSQAPAAAVVRAAGVPGTAAPGKVEVGPLASSAAEVKPPPGKKRPVKNTSSNP